MQYQCLASRIVHGTTWSLWLFAPLLRSTLESYADQRQVCQLQRLGIALNLFIALKPLLVKWRIVQDTDGMDFRAENSNIHFVANWRSNKINTSQIRLASLGSTGQ
jgi:hypothetical protein